MSFPYSTRIYLQRLPHLRTFSTAPRLLAPSFLDLRARSVSRENGHFSKLSGVNYIEHSPALQLLRSERDLAEGKAEVEPTGILLTPEESKDTALSDEYKKQIEALRAQIVAKDQSWHERYNNERKEWEDAEEKGLRLKLLFGISLVLAGALAADGLALAEEVEQHCSGCFDGNSKNQLFVVGYLKQTMDGLSQWWNGERSTAGTRATRLARQEHVASNASAQHLKSDLPHFSYSAVDSGLPRGWEEKATPEGRKYFVDHNEKSNAWSNPHERPNASARSAVDVLPSEKNATSVWQRLMWAKPRTT
jgi:hypothetical protein